MLERKTGRSRERRLKQTNTPRPKDWEGVACLPLLLRPHQVPVLGSETPHPYNKFPSLLKLVGTRFLLLTRNRVLTYTRTRTQSCENTHTGKITVQNYSNSFSPLFSKFSLM